MFKMSVTQICIASMIIAIFFMACTPNMQEKSMDEGVVDALQTPIPLVLASPSIAPSLSYTPTPQLFATPVQSYELGIIYEAYSGGIYSWNLLEKEPLQSVLDMQVSKDSIYATDRTHSPANSELLAFSYFSDMVAYWTLTTPSQLWISDVHYDSPKLIFEDSGASYSNVEIENLSALMWMPNDSHLLVYSFQANTPHLIYDLDDNVLSEWLWLCNSVILSPKTNHLGILCYLDETKTNSSVNTDIAKFAVIEWGGDIWYASEEPQNIITQPLSNGKIPWSVSPDGTKLAYLDISSGYIYVLNENGNVDKVIEDVYWHDQTLVEDSGESNRTSYEVNSNFLHWSRNGKLLLAYILTDSTSLCRPILDVFTSEFYQAPCWHIIDVEAKQVVWTDVQSISTLFEDDFERDNIVIDQAIWSPNSLMIAIRGQHLDYQLFAIVDIESFEAHRLAPLPYAQIYWAR